MDIFTYLMSKKGKNYLPHKNDLFAYLLGKSRYTPIEPKVATGTTINITALKTNVDEFKLSKLSTQDGTPTPENPIEVKTVKGYRNLFDGQIELGSINPSNGSLVTNNSRTRSTNYIKVEPNTTYSFRRSQTGGYRWIIGYTENKEGITDGNAGGYASAIYNSTQPSTTLFTFTTTSTTHYIKWYDTASTNVNEQVMVNVGSTFFPYVPYGKNWIYTTITDGTNTKNIPLPLNNNEIAGIGDYKDEYIVDKNGHCWLNKKTGKYILDGDVNKFIAKSPYFTSDTKGFYQFSLSNKYVGNDGDTSNGKSNYFMFRTGSANAAFRNYSNGLWWEGNNLNCYAILELTTLADANAWLLEHNTTIYYKLKESAFTLIDLNYDIDLKLYVGNNRITNSETADMYLIYY